MAGMLVFRSLREALQAGFQVYDKTADGYIVRQRVAGDVWRMAIVALREPQALPDHPDSSQIAVPTVTDPQEWR
jgi:hypothetical protein